MASSLGRKGFKKKKKKLSDPPTTGDFWRFLNKTTASTGSWRVLDLDEVMNS